MGTKSIGVRPDTQGRQTARAIAPTRCHTLADCARQPAQPPSPFPDGRKSAASVPRNDACKHLCDLYPRSANCPRRCCPTLLPTVRVSRRSPHHRFVGGRKSVLSTARANMRASIGVTRYPGSANGTCWPESVDRWAPVSIATSRVDHSATRWPTVHLRGPQKAFETPKPRSENCLRPRTSAHRHCRRLFTAAGTLPPPFLDGRKSIPSTTRTTIARHNQLRSHIRIGNPLFSGCATLSSPAAGAFTDAGRDALAPEHAPP